MLGITCSLRVIHESIQQFRIGNCCCLSRFGSRLRWQTSWQTYIHIVECNAPHLEGNCAFLRVSKNIRALHQLWIEQLISNYGWTSVMRIISVKWKWNENEMKCKSTWNANVPRSQPQADAQPILRWESCWRPHRSAHMCAAKQLPALADRIMTSSDSSTRSQWCICRQCWRRQQMQIVKERVVESGEAKEWRHVDCRLIVAWFGLSENSLDHLSGRSVRRTTAVSSESMTATAYHG